ncbi:MAG: T9SS type A sorting domain-containing protein [bacterium]|nr:T9SS type A sorting domain-containing protein [bacterium]
MRNLIGIGLLALLISVQFAQTALAGANETPGKNYQPHRFGSFHGNLFEFGYQDLQLFKIHVVEDQHYRVGACYADSKRDNSPGGAGLFNFQDFISDNKYDVMLFTSHGTADWETVIEFYEFTAPGFLIRAQQLALYHLIYDPDEVIAVDGEDWLGIAVTESFYDRFMRTPDALAWWASCYSIDIELVDPGQARAYVGYDDYVVNMKVNCDERYVLGRMDGQMGQQWRPLKKAIEGVNSQCPPNDASLEALGKLNTTLSPSVIEWEPTGVVCVVTPGHVKLDTSLDVSIDPRSVVKAYGDADLINHSWSGDDRIDFTVVPTRPYPNIEYRVKEAKAVSKADHARLDGNTWPGPQNAYGPNRDDFVWNTTCPGGSTPPSTPSTPTPVSPPSTPTTPGGTTRVPTPVTNGGTTDQVITITLYDVLTWCSNPDTTFLSRGGGSDILFWDFEVPTDALPGTINTFTITIEGEGEPFVAHGEIVVPSLVAAALLDNPAVLTGQIQEKRLIVENNREVPVDVDNLTLLSSEPIMITPDLPGFTLEAGGEIELLLMVDVPPGPDNMVFPVQVTADLTGETCEIGGFDLVSGLTIVLPGQDLEVPTGSPGTPRPLPIENTSGVPFDVQVLAVDSHGWPVSVPPALPLGPLETAEIPLGLSVPPDPLLIGQTGNITLELEDPILALSSTHTIHYTIGPALEIVLGSRQMENVYTGCAGCPFMWHLDLQNSSIEMIEGEIELLIDSGGALPLLAPIPIMMGPGEIYPFDFALPELPPGFAPGLYPVTIEATTSSGLGDFSLNTEMKITTPVTATMIQRAVAGYPGEEAVVSAVIGNQRSDMPMNGEYEITDSMGWLPEPVLGIYDFEPEGLETLDVFLSPPPRGALDSTEVTLRITMLDDFGGLLEDMASTWLKVFEEPVGIEDGPPPAHTDLMGNYPNPFNPRTSVEFNLERAGDIRLSVHDVAGRVVSVLHEGYAGAGRHSHIWEGMTDDGVASSGVYFIRLETADGIWSSKAVLIR